MNRLRFASWIFVVLLLVGLMILLAGLPVESSDFYPFYQAALALQRGENVYAIQPNGVQIFFNPLWAAFPFVPLTAFDAEWAFQVWRLVLFLLLAATIYPLMRLYHVRLMPGWAGVIGWLILMPWFVGQNAPLVAAGAFLTIVFAAGRRWLLAGAMMPLLAIKPQTVLLFPLAFLLVGRRSVLASALASVSVASISAWLVQLDWLGAWLGSRWGESQSGGGQSWPASGILNMLDFLNLPVWLYPFFVLVALGLFWRYRYAEWQQLAAFALGLGTVIAPYIRAGDFVLLLPIFFLLPKSWLFVLVPTVVAIFALQPPVPLLWLIPALVVTTFVVARERKIVPVSVLSL